jgi:hypothetical protein
MQALQPPQVRGSAAAPAAAAAPIAPTPPGLSPGAAAPDAAGDTYDYEELNNPSVGGSSSAGGSNGGSNGNNGSNGSGSSDGTPTEPGADSSNGDDGSANGDDGSSSSSDNGDADVAPEEEEDQGSTTFTGSDPKNTFKLDPNDPYGLDIDFGKNSKINDPFAPAAPPSPAPSPSPTPPPAGPTKARLQIDIQPDAFVQAVPPSFVGISREWTPFVWYDDNPEAWERVFAQLGPAPILRIGGATQEGLTKVCKGSWLSPIGLAEGLSWL